MKWDVIMRDRALKRIKEQGLSWNQVAQDSDIPYGTLHGFLNSDTRELKPMACVRLAEALSVSVEWLLTGKNTDLFNDPRFNDILAKIITRWRDEESNIEPQKLLTMAKEVHDNFYDKDVDAENSAINMFIKKDAS